EGAPGLADELARALGAGETFGRGVLRQNGQTVSVRDRALGADGGDDQVAIPGREFLERGEQLLPLGPACGPAHALLRLAGRQIERLELGFRDALRLGGTFASALEDPLRRVTRLELRIGVDRARDLEQRLGPACGLRVEQACSPVEPAGREARQCRRLVRGQTGSPRVDLLTDRALREPSKRNALAA